MSPKEWEAYRAGLRPETTPGTPPGKMDVELARELGLLPPEEAANAGATDELARRVKALFALRAAPSPPRAGAMAGKGADELAALVGDGLNAAINAVDPEQLRGLAHINAPGGQTWAALQELAARVGRLQAVAARMDRENGELARQRDFEQNVADAYLAIARSLLGTLRSIWRANAVGSTEERAAQAARDTKRAMERWGPALDGVAPVPGFYDVWTSHDGLLVPQVDEEAAQLLCRALNAWDNLVGAEMATWYTPTGMEGPEMHPPALGDDMRYETEYFHRLEAVAKTADATMKAYERNEWGGPQGKTPLEVQALAEALDALDHHRRGEGD